MDSPIDGAPMPPVDWPDRLDWLVAQEERIADLIGSILTGIVEAAADAYFDTLIAAGDLSAFDGIPGQWQMAVTGRVLPELNGMFLAGGISAWISNPNADLIPDEAALGWANVVNEEAVAYQRTATNRLAGVGDTLWRNIRDDLARTIEAGATNEAIKERVRGLGRFSEFRADMIARTETMIAFSNGNYEASLALGESGPVEKVWLATLDGRTREDHAQANGTYVAFSQPFIVGGVPMRGPHDPNAPAEQIIQCRCVLLELYPGDQRPDGSTVPQRGAESGQVSRGFLTPVDQPRQAFPRPSRAEIARAKRTYRRLTADSPEVKKIAREFDLDPDLIIMSRARGAQAKREVREQARHVQIDAAKQLEQYQALRMKTPGRNPSAEYDWFEGLDPREKTRLRTRWMRDDPIVQQPDEIAAVMRDIRDFETMDEAIDEWLRLTRVHDAAGAVASGKIPAARSYSNAVDVRALVSGVDETVDIVQLIGADDLRAGALVLDAERSTLTREALELLDAAAVAEVGPAPHRMSFISWFDELLDVEYELRVNPNPPRAVQRRHDELLPEAFVDPDATAEVIYARLIATARQAGLEVSDNAIVPWA